MKLKFKFKTQLIACAYVLLVSVFLFGCEKTMITPIEKYGDSKYVVSNKKDTFWSDYNIQLKNKDTIFWITVLSFDGKNIKTGDTLR